MRKKVLAEKSVKQGLNQFQYVEQLGHKEAGSLILPLLYSIQYVAYGGLLLFDETSISL